jgi:hypothetical protein
MKWLAFLFGIACACLTTSLLQAQSAAAPVTATSAKAVLDLSKKPFADPLERPILNVAWQQFETKGSPEAVAEAIDAALIKLGLQQQAGAMFSETYSAATYQKAGFTFSLSVIPSGYTEAYSECDCVFLNP